MPKKVLLIDDEKDMSELVKMRLESAGFEVEYAYDGLNGIDKAKKTHPDIILLDLFLPLMSGYEVCKKLKEIDELKDVPVVFFSAGHTKKDYLKEKKATGAVDFVGKPFDPQELINKINFYTKD